MKQLDTREQMEDGAMSRRSVEAASSAGNHHVTPLLEASETYPALEERIYAARTEVLLGFRLLDPKTRIRSGELRRAGISNWGDLIAAVAARGVDVRILLTDFEPTVATHLHTLTWAAVRGFRAASPTPPSNDDRARSHSKRTPQIIAALHEARVGSALRYMLWPLVWLRVRRLAAARGMSRDALLQDAPGLAPLFGAGGWDVLARAGPPRLRPATYHQKLAIIDGEYLVIGGLDVDERRFDDATHDRPADDTWHDLSLLITGPVCADARSHFVDCWNREVRPFRRRVRRLRRFVRDLPAPPDPLTSKDAPQRQPTDSRSNLRFIRTLSRQRRSLVEFGPRPAILEIERAHVEAIGRAELFIYIETQFLRSPEIVRALCDAARRAPDLRLVLLIPSAPQEVLFENAQDPAQRHGEWLQVRGLDRLIAAFGDRFAAFSLINRRRRDSRDDRRTIGPHPVVYIHSKVCVVDHREAIVSSANLNGRSLRWDTEAGVIWKDGDAVRAFEERLWRRHLGAVFDGQDMTLPPKKLLDLWNAAGEERAPSDRPSFVAPYPLEESRSFARRSWAVPDNLV